MQKTRKKAMVDQHMSKQQKVPKTELSTKKKKITFFLFDQRKKIFIDQTYAPETKKRVGTSIQSSNPTKGKQLFLFVTENS